MTVKAPGRALYHSDRRVPFGGGVFSDTSEGTVYAGVHGYGWIDCDLHLMLATLADLLLPVRLRRTVWVNAHGAPFLPSWVRKGQKFEGLVWAVVRRLHRDLRSAARMLKENAKAGLSTELEPKNLRPLASDKQLRAAFRRLARAARRAYGDDWQRRTVVKCLTNLGGAEGGLVYCKRVLAAAHAEGFNTMVLPRGPHVHEVISEPYITYNRGGLC